MIKGSAAQRCALPAGGWDAVRLIWRDCFERVYSHFGGANPTSRVHALLGGFHYRKKLMADGYYLALSIRDSFLLVFTISAVIEIDRNGAKNENAAGLIENR